MPPYGEPLFFSFGGSGWDDVWGFGTSASKGGPYSTRCRWDGAAWQQCEFFYEPTMSVWGVSPSRTVAAGFGLKLWDGTSWSNWLELDDAPSPSLISLLRGTSETDLWAVVGRGVRHYDGSGWAQVDMGFLVSDLWVNSEQDVWAVGEKGRATHFDGVWTSSVVGTEELAGVWAARNGEAWAVGPGTLAHYANGAWSTSGKQGSPSALPGVDFKGVWGSGELDVWAVGEQRDVGHVYHWDGAVWTQLGLELLGGGATIFGTERDLWIGGYTTAFHGKRVPRH